MIWQKGGEEFGDLYMHVYLISLFYTKRGRRILYVCFFSYFIAYMCRFAYDHSLHIFMFIAMHELRGSFYEA